MKTDTPPEALAVQAQIYREMTGAQRVHLAFEMSETAREISLGGIRQRNPDFNETQVLDEYFRIVFGPELAREISLMKSESVSR